MPSFALCLKCGRKYNKDEYSWDELRSSNACCMDLECLGTICRTDAWGYPVAEKLREKGYQFNAEIHIGKNCWLGAGVKVMPGVTIGDNTVIGAGSVVTHDIPANVVAVGVPCRVMREISHKDREIYFKDKRIDPSLIDCTKE